ncbi:hypothetical protein EW145_g3737 [Phellinidium pouzarii]|uniref:Uncharacterized protein n=1 Tax=Phellinidium pouzarii TaxID=167371 RepID=A0A4S4L7Y2_9AGAM|nr:hypothetical protein EW145_g3737 [Phellinidium pouzarii]
MTAPSFSSFPPVFSSFPDVKPSLSSRPQSPHVSEHESLKHAKHKDKKRRNERGSDCNKDNEIRIGHEKEGYRKKRDRHRDGTSKHANYERSESSRHRTKQMDDEREHDAKHTQTADIYSRVFFQDGKGDPLNITYGGLHTGDIPKYWLVSHGKKALGLDPRLSILYRGGKGAEVGESGWHNRAPQLTDSRARTLLAGQTRRLTTSARTLLRYEEVNGFVRVPSGKVEGKYQAYRSITREDEDNSDSGSSSASGNESSDYESESSPMTAREESLRDLEQKLREDPTSIPDWLRLVENSLNGVPSTSRNAEKAHSEISVSILSRALSEHPDNALSSLLRLKYLKMGENIWNERKLNSEWDDALRLSESADICVEWLDWRMRSSADFNNVLRDACKALELVARGLKGDCVELARLRIFWRTAIFLQQAGYVERGFAMFQAQAEMYVLHSLKVGEPFAKGWKLTTETKHGDGDVGASEAVKIGESDSSDSYKTWHCQEKGLDRRLFMPTRASNMDEDDPYSTILFTDVRPFLFSLQSAKGRDRFRLVWLSFMGLHIPGLSSSLSSSSTASDDRWADTAFMQPEFLEKLFPKRNSAHLDVADSLVGVTIGREKIYKPSFEAVKAWSLGVLEPLEGLTIDGRYRMWEKRKIVESDGGVHSAIGHIFKQVRRESEDLQWDILGLAFEATKPDSRSALKRSQNLLSVNSSSPELLTAHAYLERMNGKNDKARKVYKVGLDSLAQGNEDSVVCLWWGAVELEWLLSQNDVALELILRGAGQPGEQTGVHILRAKRRLEEICQQENTSKWRLRLNWIKLRLLLELLTGTIEAAIAIVKRFQRKEERGELEHESLTVASLLMIYHHTVTLRNSASPALLRGLVHEALEVYPSNSVVLGLFLECEKGEGVWGRVRALMGEKTGGMLQEKSIARRLTEVWIANWEEGRWLGEVERVRSGLESAVACDRTKGSAIIWNLFVKFEIAAGNLKRAKSVLFRALGECPLVKDLYLLAFDDDLRHVFSNRELMGLSDTMIERNLRLRMSLGEFLESHEYLENEDVTNSGDDENEDELEYDSREY